MGEAFCWWLLISFAFGGASAALLHAADSEGWQFWARWAVISLVMFLVPLVFPAFAVVEWWLASEEDSP